MKDKLILTISLTANIFLLLLLYIATKSNIGSLCFDKNKAASIIVHKADCHIIDYIKDNMSDGNALPGRERLYKAIRENPFLNNSSVEIIYSPQNLTSFRGDQYNLLVFDKETGMGKWSKIEKLTNSTDPCKQQLPACE